MKTAVHDPVCRLSRIFCVVRLAILAKHLSSRIALDAVGGQDDIGLDPFAVDLKARVLKVDFPHRLSEVERTMRRRLYAGQQRVHEIVTMGSLPSVRTIVQLLSCTLYNSGGTHHKRVAILLFYVVQRYRSELFVGSSFYKPSLE